MCDEDEETPLLLKEDHPTNHGALKENGHALDNDSPPYEGTSDIRVRHISPILGVERREDSPYEHSITISHAWDKMLLDDLVYQGDQTEKSDSKITKAFSRCKPSRKTKENLSILRITVLFLMMVVCTTFFIMSDEARETPDIIAVSNSLSYVRNIPEIGDNSDLRITCTGPFVDLANINTTETITLSVFGITSVGENFTVGQVVYEVNRDHPVSESGYWTEEEKSFDVGRYYSKGTNFSAEFTSNTNDTLTLSVEYILLPWAARNEVIWAAIILVGIYVMIGFELVHRTTAAMLGAFAVLGVLTSFNQRPSLEVVMEWLDYDTLALLWGMMTIVAIFSETGFFDYCALLSYKYAKGKIWPLVTILCFFSGIVSAFLDNVTTILLLTPVTISLCEVLGIDPRYVLIAEVVFSNIGGTATAIGDPPNVIIVSNSDIQNAHYLFPTILGIDFTTFTLHMSIGIVFCMIVGYLVLRLMYRKINLVSLEPPQIRELKHEIEVWRQAAVRIMVASKEESTVKALLLQKVSQLETQLRNQIYKHRQTTKENINWKDKLKELEKQYRITDKVLLAKCSFILIVVIVLFFTHSLVTQLYLNLGWIAVIGAVALLLLADVHDIENVMHRVEWATLLFFAALFVLMEGLTELGLIEFIGDIVADLIEKVPPDQRLTVALILIIWVSALASSFIDNIPFTTAMIPVILDLAERDELGLPLNPMVYALAFGACLGGNGTLIGASANVVCAGIADQHGYGFSFVAFLKVGFPMMLSTTTVAMVYLIICHSVIGWND